jgi:flagellar hook-basal body complex protein FliE
MTLAQLQRFRSVAAGLGDGELPRPGGPAASGAGSFGETLQHALNQVDGAQKAADTQVEAFVAGEQENLHEVMIAMNEAKLSFQLMTEVRNRMLETYQELMRMQV